MYMRQSDDKRKVNKAILVCFLWKWLNTVPPFRQLELTQPEWLPLLVSPVWQVKTSRSFPRSGMEMWWSLMHATTADKVFSTSPSSIELCLEVDYICLGIPAQCDGQLQSGSGGHRRWTLCKNWQVRKYIIVFSSWKETAGVYKEMLSILPYQ